MSLLPSLSKVLEKLIKICLLKFFDKHQVLYENQYGFREKYSTLHALLDVTSETYNAIQRNHSALMFIDLRKEFDTDSVRLTTAFGSDHLVISRSGRKSNLIYTCMYI